MTRNPPPRTCAAVGCKAPVDRLYVFCPTHRAALPPELLLEIRKACRPGTGDSLRITPGWLEAVASAVEWLAESEERPPANRFRDRARAKAPA